MVLLRYLHNLSQACQCLDDGAKRNWLNLLTENAIWGLVKFTYCKAPIMLLYWEELLMTVLEFLVTYWEVAIGVRIGLQVSMPCLANKLAIYLLCDIWIPSLVFVTLILRK